MRVLPLILILCQLVIGRKTRSSSSEEDLAMLTPMLNAMGELSGVMKQTIKVASEDEGFRRDISEVEINPLNLLSTAMSTMLETLSQRVPNHIRQRTKESKVPHPFSKILSRHNQQSQELNGPHICVKEINRKMDNPEKSVNVTQRCETFSQAVRCIQRRLTPEGSVETIRVQECCKGFTTDDITLDGCDQEVVPQSLESILSTYDATKMPSNLPPSFTVIFSKLSPENVNIFPIQMMDYDLHDNDILTSTDDKKFIVNHINQKTFINCVPINESNVFLTNGIAMITERDIHPAERTVLEILEKDARFSVFLSVLSESVKVKLGSSSSSVTVMPFTDSRFEEFPAVLKEQIKSKQRCTASVIEKSHIFHKATCSQSLTSALPSVAVTPMSKENRIGEANIIESDLVALNGIVHVVDNIIMKEEITSWQQKLNSSSPLMTQLLRDQIDDNQPVTILVPTKLNDSSFTKEDALNQVIPWLLPSLNALPPTITTMGNSTIFAGRFGSFTSSVSVFRVRKRPTLSNPQIGCSRLISDPVTQENQLSACGSTIFFLDMPIPKVVFTMKELLESRSDISRSSALFSLYSANHTLPRVSTLFVPVDDAFAVNYFKKLKNDDEANEKLIQTHLVSRPICQQDLHQSEDIVSKEVIINKNGDMLRVNGNEEETAVEGSKILETIVVSDGVVHLLENVIRKESSSFRTSHFDEFSPFSRH